MTTTRRRPSPSPAQLPPPPVDLLQIHLLVTLWVCPWLVVGSIEPVALLKKHLEGAAYPVVGSHHGALCLPHPVHLSGQLPHRLHKSIHPVQECLVTGPSGPGLRWPCHLLDLIVSDDCHRLLDLLLLFATSWQCRDSLAFALVHTRPGPSSLDLQPLTLFLETSAPLAGMLFGLLQVLHTWHPKLDTTCAAFNKSAKTLAKNQRTNTYRGSMAWTPLCPATGSSLVLFFIASPAFCFPAATSTQRFASALHLSSAIRHTFSSRICWHSAWSFVNSSQAFLSTSSLAFHSASAHTFCSASSHAHLAASSRPWHAHSSASTFACL